MLATFDGCSHEGWDVQQHGLLKLGEASETGTGLEFRRVPATGKWHTDHQHAPASLGQRLAPGSHDPCHAINSKRGHGGDQERKDGERYFAVKGKTANDTSRSQQSGV